MKMSKLTNSFIGKLLLKQEEGVMEGLGYGNHWNAVEKAAKEYPRLHDDETGKELYVEDIVTPQLTNVSEVNEYAEEHALGLGDRIGKAELCDSSDESEEVYEKDFHDAIVQALEENVVFKEGHVFITPEQHAANFTYWLRKLSSANHGGDLVVLAKELIAIQQEENGSYFFAKGVSKEFWNLYRQQKEALKMRTFKYYVKLIYSCKSIQELGALASEVIELQKVESIDADGKVQHDGWNLFPAGMSKQFWEIYADQKASVSKKRESDSTMVIHEFEDIIANAKYPWQLKKIKQEIYTAKVGYGIKRGLWDYCDERIEELTA